VNTVCRGRQQSLSMLVQPAAEQQRASVNFPVRPSGNGGNAGGLGGAGGGSSTAATP
jgi:hypothetical protein